MANICKAFSKNYAISVQEALIKDNKLPLPIDILQKIALKLWNHKTWIKYSRTLIRGFLHPEMERWRTIFYSWPSTEFSMDASDKLFKNMIERVKGKYSYVVFILYIVIILNIYKLFIIIQIYTQIKKHTN